jgi:hypothetical protein
MLPESHGLYETLSQLLRTANDSISGWFIETLRIVYDYSRT